MVPEVPRVPRVPWAPEMLAVPKMPRVSKEPKDNLRFLQDPLNFSRISASSFRFSKVS